jgi:hypothetical protein
MKMSKCFELHHHLRNALGGDLVFSLVIDGGQYMVAVSTHRSQNQKFKSGHRMRTLMLTEEDLQRPVGDVVLAIVKHIQPLLMPFVPPVDDPDGEVVEMEKRSMDDEVKMIIDQAGRGDANVTN